MNAADGSAQVNLTHTPDSSESGPAWSPDGERILFQSTPVPDCCTFHIHVMNADGSGRTLLTDGLDPAWSPDGRKIAFYRQGDIWLMNPDGSEQARLTTNAAHHNRMPSWSPDGQWIAFESPRVGIGEYDIYLVNVADPSIEIRLTDAPGPDRRPDWGPPVP